MPRIVRAVEGNLFSEHVTDSPAGRGRVEGNLGEGKARFVPDGGGPSVPGTITFVPTDMGGGIRGRATIFSSTATGEVVVEEVRHTAHR